MVFLFLRSVWATVIPSVAVPLSLVGTFGVMYLLRLLSLDNLSLMALTISTGFVVDDAIVVTENVTRFVEAGRAAASRRRCAAPSRSASPSSASPLSLLAVFIPILLMGGIIGRLFREFAVTLAIAIGISALISLTLTPMMCARMLAHKKDEQPGRLERWLEARLRRRCRTRYGRGAALRACAIASSSALVTVGDGGAHRVPLHHRAEGALPAAGHGPARAASPTRRRTSRSRR